MIAAAAPLALATSVALLRFLADPALRRSHLAHAVTGLEEFDLV
ncbi:hypothetical protein ABZ897_24335 [Nonomuraea sp. NPDC046802]